MWFRRRREQSDEAREGWATLARSLDFEPVPDEVDSLAERLGSEDGAPEAPFALRRPGQPELLLFRRAQSRRLGPTQRRPVALLSSDEAFSPCSLRAFPRGNSVLANLQANRSGGTLLATGHETFDEAVGVVARDVEAATELLTPGVRAALTQLVGADGDGTPLDVEVAIGKRHLMWSARAEVAAPYAPVAQAAVGLLSVYAALRAR